MAADIPCITTVPGRGGRGQGIEALIRGEMSVRPLQELHAALRATPTVRDRRVRSGSPGRCCSGWAAATPRRAHERTLRGLAERPRWPGRLAALPPCGPAPARPGPCSGLRFPNPVGLAAGMDKDGRRAAGLAGARASASSRSARSPGTPSRATSGPGCSGCRPTRRSSTGWASTTPGPPPSPRRLARASGRCRCRWDQPRQVQGHPAGRGGRGLPGVAAAAAPVRRLLRGQRQLAEHPGPALPAGRAASSRSCWRALAGRGRGHGRCWSRSRPDLTDDAARRAARRVPGRPGRRGDRHQHHASSGRLAATDAHRRSRPAGCPAGRCARAGPRWCAFVAKRERAAGHRCRRHHSAGRRGRGCSTPARAWSSSTPA